MGDLLVPHLQGLGWVVDFSILKTKRVAHEPAGRGGVSTWIKIHREIDLLLRSRFDLLTTVIDYYGFPPDAPGMGDRPRGDAVARVEHVERAVAERIDHPTFLPHLVLHETETWVLAAIDHVGELRNDVAGARSLRQTVAECGGPEFVNDGPTTAPSKRLLAQWPTYRKTLEGPLAIAELGLPRLRQQCPHLDGWLRRIEALG